MSKLKIILASLTIFLMNVPLVLAKCTLNGKEIPCSEMPKWLFVLPFIVLVVGILVFIFWLWMLIDAIKNQEENKIMWVLIIILLVILGAIIYYFNQKRKRKALSQV